MDPTLNFDAQPDYLGGGSSPMGTLELIGANAAQAVADIGAGRMPYDPAHPNYQVIRPPQTPASSGISGLLSNPLVLIFILWLVFK